MSMKFESSSGPIMGCWQCLPLPIIFIPLIDLIEQQKNCFVLDKGSVIFSKVFKFALKDLNKSDLLYLIHCRGPIFMTFKCKGDHKKNPTIDSVTRLSKRTIDKHVEKKTD